MGAKVKISTNTIGLKHSHTSVMSGEYLRNCQMIFTGNTIDYLRIIVWELRDKRSFIPAPFTNYLGIRSPPSVELYSVISTVYNSLVIVTSPKALRLPLSGRGVVINRLHRPMLRRCSRLLPSSVTQTVVSERSHKAPGGAGLVGA